MRSYARYYLETFRLQIIPDERIRAGMHVNQENVDLTLEHMKNGRGVIYALPHMGDFEQAGRWVILVGAGSITAPAERLKPESVFQKFLAFRQGLGMEVVPTTGGPHPFGVMAQRLRAGKLVTIVADRDLSDTGVEVDFFGEKALFPAGPAALAVQTGAALMPVSCWFVGEAEWAAHVYDEIPVPADGHPQGEGRRDDPGPRHGLRAGDPRAPGGLAHAAEGLRQRPRPRAARPQPRPGRRAAGERGAAHDLAGRTGRRPARGTAESRARYDGGFCHRARKPGGAPVRIGIACPYSWDVPGGVQQHIRDLAEALIELGHEVSVIAPADEDRPLPPYVVPAGKAMPVPYNGSVARLAFGPLSTHRVRRWLRDGNFDVLHVHEPAVPSLSLLACWVASGPIVATVHTAMRKSRVLLATQPVLRSALEKIDGRIAVSEAARSTFVEHLGGDAVLIPNGVATRRYLHADPLDGWPGEGGAIGFLGRMDEPRKGLAVLLRAFELLAPGRPGLRLLIAGHGDIDEQRRSLPAELRDRAVFLGEVSEEDKVRVLHSVDVFCSPNTGGESFGIVTAEAMAAGLPIVASDIPAFRDVLRDGQAGELFVTGDADDLARVAARLLDDPARRAELSVAALDAVADYDWGTVARNVLSVYETVVLGRTTVGIAQ